MKNFKLKGIAATALMAAPAFAQDTASSGQEMRDKAIQSAQDVGVQDVSEVQGAFILQGVTAQSTPILMAVGPAGELLSIATPIAVAGVSEGSGGEVGVEAGTVDGNGQLEAGEPATGGFMATQSEPATPQMWDPAAVEAAIQSLELGVRGVAGEVPAQ